MTDVVVSEKPKLLLRPGEARPAPRPPRLPSRGCARCGSCCDPVAIDFATWTGVVEHARVSDALSEDQAFIAANLRPVASHSGKIELRCVYYDREHRECRAYDKRPRMCRGYPWYEEEPNPVTAMLAMYISDDQPCCSFVADLPPSERPPGARPLIPLTVVLRDGGAWRCPAVTSR